MQLKIKGQKFLCGFVVVKKKKNAENIMFAEIVFGDKYMQLRHDILQSL